MILALLLATGLTLASEPVPELQQIDAAIGSSDWDRAVAFHLIVAYDRNGSGLLDRRREVRAIPCDVWNTLDYQLAAGSDYPGLLATYGFRKDLVWLGGTLGFHKRQQGRAERQMRACGVVDEGPDLGPEPDRKLGEMVAGMISVIPDPGSSNWYGQVHDILAVTYDLDGSRMIDDPIELRGMPCIVWIALDYALRKGGEDGLVSGMWAGDFAVWRGERLGLSESISVDVLRSLLTCGVGAP